MMLSEEIRNLMHSAIDAVRGRPTSSKDTLILIDAIPYSGIISFQEPDINFDFETKYTSHQLLPQAILVNQRTIPEGTLTVLESTLWIMKGSYFSMARNFGSETDIGIGFGMSDSIGDGSTRAFDYFELGKVFTITKIMGIPQVGFDPGLVMDAVDFRELKIYPSVIATSESRPQLDSDTKMMTVDLDLMFFQEPISVPFSLI